MIDNFAPINPDQQNKDKIIKTEKDENDKQYKSSKELINKKKKNKLQFMSRDNSFQEKSQQNQKMNVKELKLNFLPSISNQ